jgi:succinate dehydrogenase / fumarate reductase cytochrome b subunit
LANGIWTAGITWGVWTTPRAMRRAIVGCGVFGVLLAAVSMGALIGMATVNVTEAQQAEVQMRNARLMAGEIRDKEKLEKSDPQTLSPQEREQLKAEGHYLRTSAAADQGRAANDY